MFDSRFYVILLVKEAIRELKDTVEAFKGLVAGNLFHVKTC